jgi:dinuclear metal center YbgI/SA1388 family protein
MATVADVLRTLEEIAPIHTAFPFDRVGLQVGDPTWLVERAIVTLDRSLAAITRAAETGARLVLAHHPLIFEPISAIDLPSHVSRALFSLIEGKIAFIAAHTNWDCASGGVNDALARALELRDPTSFGSHSDRSSTLKLVTFVPHDHLERLLDALAAAGAGRIGLYERCAFHTAGTGTFRPLPGANPTIGAVGASEEVPEARLEMELLAARRPAVERALRAHHPYEEPAYEFYSVLPKDTNRLGRIGELGHQQSLREFADWVDAKLGTRSWVWGNPERIIRRVAVVGGAADGEWPAALAEGADAFVTGEVKQHVALEAVESGLAMIAAGHYATEQPGVVALAEAMREHLPQIRWDVFEPRPGDGGRCI